MTAFRLPPSPPQHVTVPRLGNLRWAELRAFELFGQWVVDTGDDEVGVAFANASRHAAARARLLADRLPSAGNLRADEVTRPSSDQFAAVVEELAAAETPAARLAGAVALLDSLAAAVDALLPTLSAVADGPSLRALPLVRADLDAERQVLGALARATGAEPGPVEDRLKACGGP
jgi:hypothetical protein